MNVNGITGVTESYTSSYQYTEASEKVSTASESTAETDESGVVYEQNTIEVPTSTTKANRELIEKLKQDAEARVAQLQNIVEQLISKQSTAYANANDIWSVLREGDFTVDPETKAQAEADIAEDGYWGVEATSDRIIDFAVALTGGDTSKLGDMLEAFKKGYAQAEETWGGELPEISQKTYDAVISKFNALMEEEAE